MKSNTRISESVCALRLTVINVKPEKLISATVGETVVKEKKSISSVTFKIDPKAFSICEVLFFLLPCMGVCILSGQIYVYLWADKVGMRKGEECVRYDLEN